MQVCKPWWNSNLIQLLSPFDQFNPFLLGQQLLCTWAWFRGFAFSNNRLPNVVLETPYIRAALRILTGYGWLSASIALSRRVLYSESDRGFTFGIVCGGIAYVR